MPKPPTVDREVSKSYCKGTWFKSIAYWLFPVGETIRFPPGLKHRSTGSRSAPRASEFQRYNSQPNWHIRSLAVHRKEEVPEVVNEFVRMAAATSLEFCWPLNDPSSHLRWRDHGWKHISYKDIESYWKDYQLGIEPASIRSEALGGPSEVQQLFSAAASRDPESLGRVWSHFPNSEDRREIIEMFFMSNERPARIPHPSELASKLVETIFEFPGSNEADLARKALLKLISVSVSRGSRVKKGRPRKRIAVAALQLLYKMSYCLAKQAHEVDDFLGNYPRLEKDRHRILAGVYPWISPISGNPKAFLSYEASKGSLQIVGHLTGVSTSLLEKMRLPSSI